MSICGITYTEDHWQCFWGAAESKNRLQDYYMVVASGADFLHEQSHLSLSSVSIYTARFSMSRLASSRNKVCADCLQTFSTLTGKDEIYVVDVYSTSGRSASPYKVSTDLTQLLEQLESDKIVSRFFVNMYSMGMA